MKEYLLTESDPLNHFMLESYNNSSSIVAERYDSLESRFYWECSGSARTTSHVSTPPFLCALYHVDIVVKISMDEANVAGRVRRLLSMIRRLICRILTAR